jgi:hypothetical protein
MLRKRMSSLYLTSMVEDEQDEHAKEEDVHS